MVGFGILGPLEVRASDGPLRIGGRHHPRLLAILLNEPNRVVPVERIVSGLWTDPPATAVRQVQNIAAELRRRLGEAGPRLRKVGSGFRIDVGGDELDLLRCERDAALAKRLREDGRLEQAEEAFRAALAEWRGPSLAGLGGAAAESAARQLDEYRLELAEERFDVGLRLGRHGDLLGEIRGLHAEHPHRQRLTELLMLALYRSGRGPEALRVYAEVRDRLTEELGADPGRPLRDLHTAVLREDPGLDLEPASGAGTPPPAPATLPAGTAAFTGRTRVLAALDEAADAAANLVVLTGAGGVGKTALALKWGHRSTDRFPGGRLYIDLRGFAPGGAAIGPAEAARRLLAAMGVEARRIPADPEAQIALLRERVCGERRLLVLDNARDADHVRPLLPDCPLVHTVVTSRRRLAGLAASHGARVFEVGAFDRAEAAALLRRQIGPERLDAEPRAAEQIVTACAGLPLALAVTAARAATRPDARLSAIAGELATARLDALSGDEATMDLRAVLSWTYDALDADAARLFRLLGLLPGADFDVDCAARLHGGPRARVASALRRLTGAHLVEDGRPGHYRLHDLLRRYAAELAEAEEPRREREAAADRLLRWYCGRAAACRALLYPEVACLPDTVGPIGPLTASADEAARWLRSEWHNLVAAVEHAAEHAPPEYVWRLADLLRGAVWFGMLGSDGVRIGRAALAAAARSGDPLGTAAAALAHSSALIRANRLREAVEHARDAAELAASAGWTAGAAAAEFNLAAASFYRGRMLEGQRHARASLKASRAVGDRGAERTTLHWLGILLALTGELDRGIEHFERALAIAAEIGADTDNAVLLVHMSEIELFRGRLDRARVLLGEASALERRSPGHDRSGDTRGASARLKLAFGDVDGALELAARVVEDRTDAADHRIRTHAVVTLAQARLAVGDHDGAIAQFDRALSATEHSSTDFHRVQALVGLAEAVWRGGDGDRAREAAEDALRAAGSGDYRFLESQARNLLAEMDLAEGRIREAAAGAREALWTNRRTGHRPGEAASLRLLARIAEADGDTAAGRRHRQAAQVLSAAMGLPEGG